MRSSALILMLAVATAVAQSSPAKKPAAKPAPSLRETVLERAHLALGPLQPEERAKLLASLTSVATDYRSPNASEWAEELFASANALSGDARRRAQAAAVGAITPIDQARAAAMLTQMEPDPPHDDNHSSDAVRGLAARRLIEVVWGRFKVAGVPVIRQLATNLGQTGNYPYSAISSVIQQLGNQNPELTEAMFRDALAAYRLDSSPSADGVFEQFLAPILNYVAPGSLREAFNLLVRNIVEHGSEGKYQAVAGGERVNLSGVDARLWRLLPLIRRVDPDLAATVVRDHPGVEQAQALAAKDITRPVQTRSLADTTAMKRMSELDRGVSLLEQSNDPNLLAQAMPDVETRAAVFAQDAQQKINRDPAQANKLLQQAMDLAGQVKPDRGRMRALADVAWSADAVGNQTIRRQAIDEAFPIAERLVRDEFDDQGHYQPGEASEILGRLVTLGMENEPEATLARIDQVSIPILRAGLLVTAASSALPDRPAKVQPAQ